MHLKSGKSVIILSMNSCDEHHYKDYKTWVLEVAWYACIEGSYDAVQEHSPIALCGNAST